MTSPTDRVEVPCPQCAELILADAKKCKHCGSWVSESAAPPPPQQSSAPVGGSVPPSTRAEPPIGPMGFGEAVSTCWSKYADFDGRARPAEFWWFVLFYFLMFLGVRIVGTLLFGVLSSGAGMLTLLFYLVFFLPYASVMVRRLHDTNRSGWWYWIILTIIGIIPLFIWLLEDGTPGDNDYGPRTA